jgi:hypothetical protein
MLNVHIHATLMRHVNEQTCVDIYLIHQLQVKEIHLFLTLVEMLTHLSNLSVFNIHTICDLYMNIGINNGLSHTGSVTVRMNGVKRHWCFSRQT